MQQLGSARVTWKCQWCLTNEEFSAPCRPSSVANIALGPIYVKWRALIFNSYSVGLDGGGSIRTTVS
jgi:hypothetical protein